MKTLPLLKYCMKNIYTLWAVSRNKYSIYSSKLLMNGSAMCVTLQYYFMKNITRYLQNCLTVQC